MKKKTIKKIKGHLHLAYGIFPMHVNLWGDNEPNVEVAKMMQYKRIPCTITYQLTNKKK